MSRFWTLIMGIGILMFGLLISITLLIGRILPTQQVAYISSKHDHFDLVLLDLYHRIPVTIFNQVNTFSWSPDGSKIAFSNYGTNIDLYILDVYSHHVQQLTNSQTQNLSPSWSPDGSKIVFSSNYAGYNAIYVMPVDCIGTFQRCATRLTPDDNRIYISPVWSPDGKRIAFVSMLSFVIGPDLSSGKPEIYVMDQNGNHVQQLTKNPSESYTPAWSPDGRYIAYLGVNRALQSASTMIIDTECDDPTACINSLFSASITPDPSWSSDGSLIVFVGDFNGSIEIYTTDTNRRYLQRLTYDNINKGNPRWRP